MAKIKKILLIIIILLPVTQIKPQAFGFGCLGFVGGYGGYSYQIYKPTGLNNYVKAFNMLHSDSLDSPMGQFGKSNGFRIGLNFFRANIEGFILTAKGFYQVLSEQNKAVLKSQNGNINSKYEVELKNW